MAKTWDRLCVQLGNVRSEREVFLMGVVLDLIVRMWRGEKKGKRREGKGQDEKMILTKADSITGREMDLEYD